MSDATDLPTFLRGLSQTFRQPCPSWMLHEAGDLIESQAAALAEARRLLERAAGAMRCYNDTGRCPDGRDVILEIGAFLARAGHRHDQ